MMKNTNLITKQLKTNRLYMKKILIPILASITLSACSITLPVKGYTEKNNEVVTGTGTGYLTGDGTFKIISSGGLVCDGIYKYPEGLSLPSVGAFKCDDGTQGDIVSTTDTGVSGYGYGMNNEGKYVQFIFGDVPNYQNMGWKSVKEVYRNLSSQMEKYIYYCDQYPLTPKCNSTM